MTVCINNFQAAENSALAASQVASLVAEARLALGYSVDDLAVTTGLINDEIIGIENGTDIDPGKLKRVAAVLKVPVSAVKTS
ncbi:XRE family transcriptional regulator [Rhizobium deserti]|uniref:XRE family transcriptional regulator n=1 Tax=Rhizobium deserti TaxID=2547961 RepID=A0A4R5UGL3_9HYPH|nr:helix-turn-helix transcriptional regulator [Rhizobium deserti]TDK35053.1 XRE family transcriptional regulator [Rhizobium deserti]